MSEFQAESTNVRAASEAQRATITSIAAQLGVDVEIPRSSTEASNLITRLLGQKARLQEPTDAQLGMARALGGVDLPGATKRDKGYQIQMLQLIQAFDLAATDEAASEVAQKLIDTVRALYVRPGFVHKAKPVATQQTEQAPSNEEPTQQTEQAPSDEEPLF